jgi:biotin transport system substrate-specific component
VKVSSIPTDILWALIGLILTIGGTFMEASVTNAPWNWLNQGVQAQSLGVSFQIGAVLLIGCLGGKNAAVMSQIAYILIGLTWFNVFTQGGGFDYVHEPSFGYLLGFIPGAWICGYLAFRVRPRLESLAFSCLCGLLSIHLIGMSYCLLATQVFSWLNPSTGSLLSTLLTYSIYPLPGQLVVVCAVTVLAFALRHLLFY